MLLGLLLALACTGQAPVDTDTGTTPDTDVPADTDRPTSQAVTVVVTLDGAPAEGATVLQGGVSTRHLTGADGRVSFDLDLTIHGEIMVIAGTPDARQRGEYVTSDDAEVTIPLERYGADNPDYIFQDPGTPSTGDDTSQCAHCHKSLVAEWYESPHRFTAENPRLQDLYTGPGGVLEALNSCSTADCSDATAFGACADCHAPGIDGKLGGRDLREATGHAKEYGVHCDVCHRVDRVDLAAEAGVAGRLVLTRPSEPGRVGLGDWLPLTFGPWPDAPNVRMGSVERSHFTDGTLCAGCHQLEQPVLVPGASLDPTRWPSGRLPVHTTYAEWKAGPQGSAGVACNACHMPPDPEAGNGMDIGIQPHSDPGYASGWVRPPSAVHKHAWYGPRTRESGFIELAAAVTVQKSVSDGVLTASVQVRNVGCGHALPTGDPLREVVLLVEASCGSEPLTPIGGDVVPDLGGYRDRKTSDFSHWTGAKVGDVVRVAKVGDYVDYPAVAPFDAFTAEQKGLRRLTLAGEATITAVDGDAVTFDRELPSGDVAWRLEPSELPADESPMRPRAGAPGFLFARVTAGADGTEGVPHYLATDVTRDNRLPPQGKYTSTHQFTATCADPTVTAVLVHRASPWSVQADRRWSDVESVMSRVTK